MPAPTEGRGAWLSGRSKRARAARLTEGATDPPGRERDGSSRTVAGSAAQASPPPDDTDPLAILRHEAKHAPLPSDRIRAATELARAERAALEVETDEARLWLARRDTLLTLPPHERLAWLLGEMKEEEGEGGDTATDAPDGWADDDIVPDGPGGGIPAPRDGTPVL